MSKIKTYTEMLRYKTFIDRYNYLRLHGKVGASTFGHDRYLNQSFYRSKEWRDLRQHIILRDNGCDLAIDDREIYDRIIIHHMNPITIEDFENNAMFVFDPEYLICTTFQTHNAIHFGDENLLVKLPEERFANDMIPWKNIKKKREVKKNA